MMWPKPYESVTTTAANPPSDAAIVLAERTAQVDRLVLREASELLAAAPAGLAILAVGGYGRRQLFPYSDIDLLLLFESERAAVAQKNVISTFLQRLWDSGLRMSHSVRTPEECAEVHDNNIELNVSLLDQRYLIGDRTLYANLARRLPKFIQGNREALVRNLARLTRERHAKYADTLYHLEPNVKETPGGLRDYQILCWMEQLRETDGAHLGAANPAPELETAFRFLARVRLYLHQLAGRDSNVLTFDAQDTIAEQSGADAAGWMRQYYRHSRAIHRAAMRSLEAAEAQSSALLAQFRHWRSRLANADFSVHRERAHFRAPQSLEVDPELVLRLFEFIARHGVRISTEAEEQIAARLDRLRAWFAEPRPVWPALSRILLLPHATLAVRLMHEIGVLTAMFPELEHIECLVIRDFYHRYTVDEHTLVAMQSVSGAHDSYAGLLSEVKQPDLLLFALLFHDAGKGAPDAGHVDGSLVFARAAMRRIQMAAQDQETVLFLIEKHLVLSAVMQGRDLFDPLTIREVAAEMETVERLKALTFLTYADINAVNPSAMTPWRAEQLWQLYLMVYNELTRELETDRIEPLRAGPPERSAFLEGFPTRYLRTHTELEIDGHMALELASRKRGVAVELRRLDSAWQLTLAATDHPGLFASVAGTLAAFGMNILRAEAFSNRRGTVLDTFAFADPNRTLDLNPSEADRLRTMVERTVIGRMDVKELLRNRPKPVLPARSARIPARVSFNGLAGNTATLVEIVAEDRPGLLYDLASAISTSGANIEVVLIDTQAHKAIDVFYVSEGGKKLNPERERVLGEALERACQPA